MPAGRSRLQKEGQAPRPPARLATRAVRSAKSPTVNRHVGQEVVAVGVETGRDQDPGRPEAFDTRNDDLVDQEPDRRLRWCRAAAGD